MAWLDLHNTKQRIWYQEFGEGQPLVLIHGWCMSSDVWYFQFLELAKSFRVIALDLPGHGNSDVPVIAFSLSFAAEVVVDLCQSLHLENILLCGWSLGGLVAIQSLLSMGKLVSALILTGVTPKFTISEHWQYGLATRDVASLGVAYRRFPAKARDNFISRMFYKNELSESLCKKKIDDILFKIQLPEISIALQGLDILQTADMRDIIKNIKLPMLIIYGNDDTICIPAASRSLTKEANVVGFIFEGCGHAPFLTRHIAWNSCLEQFVGRICEPSN